MHKFMSEFNDHDRFFLKTRFIWALSFTSIFIISSICRIIFTIILRKTVGKKIRLMDGLDGIVFILR
jgi:hypothetical protein